MSGPEAVFQLQNFSIAYKRMAVTPMNGFFFCQDSKACMVAYTAVFTVESVDIGGT